MSHCSFIIIKTVLLCSLESNSRLIKLIPQSEIEIKVAKYLQKEASYVLRSVLYFYVDRARQNALLNAFAF